MILALLGVVLCGMMPCMEFLTHYSLLAGSIPMQPIVLALTSLLVMSVLIALALQPSLIARVRSFDLGPDPALWLPLQIAFSNGILNPKVF